MEVSSLQIDFRLVFDKVATATATTVTVTASSDSSSWHKLLDQSSKVGESRAYRDHHLLPLHRLESCKVAMAKYRDVIDTEEAAGVHSIVEGDFSYSDLWP